MSGSVCMVRSVSGVGSGCEGIVLWGWMRSVCMVGRLFGDRFVGLDLAARGSVCGTVSVCEWMRL